MRAASQGGRKAVLSMGLEENQSIVLIFGWLVFINFSALSLYFLDKVAAQRGHWRVADRKLVTMAVMGGSLGSLVGMVLYRNKNRRKGFEARIKMIFVGQVGIGLALMVPMIRQEILELVRNLIGPR